MQQRKNSELQSPAVRLPNQPQALDSGLWTLDAGPDSPTDQSRATWARAERRSDMTDRQTDSLQATDPDDLHAT